MAGPGEALRIPLDAAAFAKGRARSSYLVLGGGVGDRENVGFWLAAGDSRGW